MKNSITGSRKSGGRKKLQHWQVITIWLILYDILAIVMSYFLALWIRFDCQFQKIPQEYMKAYLRFSPIYIVFCLLVFNSLRLYRSIWRFASYRELARVFEATVITGLFHIVGITVLYTRMPVTYYAFGIVIQFLMVIGVRFSYRFILLERGKRRSAEEKESIGRVMLIGAGAAGQMILRDLNGAKETNDRIYCIIDDNPNKWKRYIDGIQVVGGRDDILSSVKAYRINKIYVAIPSASPEDKRDILNICKESGCELKNLPGMYQLVTGEVRASQMRDVAIEDLLGRNPIQVNLDDICAYIKGKVCLVTGAGGSIGSELCRQIAAHEPKQLILFDVYENNVYDIQLELRKNYPEMSLVTLIGSVRDSRKIAKVFEEYRPDIVYHAAAHKHVPLMEDSPCEAIKNNTIGTFKTAYAAMLYGCKKFVLISTDKAVNPTNIMGASKRLCEMVIQSFDQIVKEGKAEELLSVRFTHGDKELDKLDVMREQLRNAVTEFVAVRFGNVLGSNGSVIPLFRKQIAQGGPVTVTHPDIIRYFMTIPEAVSLVMQAGVYASGGEIFVLDMGSAVKIDTLARNMIKLSGYKPNVDIKIQYTGLRPGEKLYEEKLMAEEGLLRTKNELIHIGKPVPFDVDQFLSSLERLMDAAYLNSPDIRGLVQEMVPTYHPE